MRRGIATFTLDYGTCPPWLFRRMVLLGREIVYVLVDEFGPDAFIERISDPVWFQSLGTVLAFDWNASGLTTILTAALKEAIRGDEKNLGVFICGGKGKTSRKTPDEIANWSRMLNLPDVKTQNLIYSSKMSAKVDSSLIQDGYQIYHHAFFFTNPPAGGGSWAVVQQGMNTKDQTARRYHWYEQAPNTAEQYAEKRLDFVDEPHKGIASQTFQKGVLNLVAKESKKTRDISTELIQSDYGSLIKDIEILRSHSSELSRMVTLRLRSGQGFKRKSEQYSLLELSDVPFSVHPVINEDFAKSKYLERILQKVTYEKPKSYESFLSMEGVGPKTVRALSLVSEVIYGASPSYEDPARYSFALGGKDAIPYPVDKPIYDKTIELLGTAIKRAKINMSEKEKTLRRLSKVLPNK